MSKILEASCDGGALVICEGFEVDDVIILSEGDGPSEGILVLDAGSAFYIAKTSMDLKDTLTQLSAALGNVASALSTLDAKPVGGSGSAPAPGVASDVTAINQAKAQLDTLKGNLR